MCREVCSFVLAGPGVEDDGAAGGGWGPVLGRPQHAPVSQPGPSSPLIDEGQLTSPLPLSSSSLSFSLLPPLLSPISFFITPPQPSAFSPPTSPLTHTHTHTHYLSLSPTHTHTHTYISLYLRNIHIFLSPFHTLLPSFRLAECMDKAKLG